MGLVNLLTDLSQFRYYTSEGYTGDGNSPGMKSLKYGNDQLGGGNSGQPYIKASIPDGFNDLQLANNDFILRGGALAARDSATDVLRLGKMFKDTKSPNGLLFIAKQNLLSRTAVKTQTSGTPNGGVYTPLSTLAEAGLVAFGGHVLKQGLNPFAGTGAYSNNSNLYEVRMNNYNEEFFTTGYFKNRLIGLYTSKINGVYNDLGVGFGKVNSISSSPLNILSYDGGPGSILGVGKTDIRFASNLTVSNPSSPKYNKTIFFPNGSTLYTQKNLSGNEGADLNTTRGTNGFTPEIQDFRKLLREELLKNGPKDPTGLPLTTTIPKAPDYKTKDIEERVNIGGIYGAGPGSKSRKNLISYTSGSGIGPVDRINALPIYPDTGVRTQRAVPVNDLVKFRIAVIDNNIDSNKPTTKTFIHFRAFIDNFSDSYNATWNPVTYLGRGENFYTYSNYTRTISMGWTVAAQSKQELIPMYKKLNYLASSLTPYYTSKGYMAGNLVQLTVGGYLYEQVGIINSLTYDIPEESPWEIGIDDNGGYDSSVKELSHIIRVSNFSFTPIQNFIPSVQPVGDGNGSSRYISLNDGTGNTNYNDPFEIENELKPLQAAQYNKRS